MTFFRDSQAVVLENSDTQPIEVLFQDEVQLDINVPLFYIKSGEEEIQAYVNKTAKPQIDGFAALKQADFQETVQAETENFQADISSYVEKSIYPEIQAYTEENAYPEILGYANSVVKPELNTVLAAAVSAAEEAEHYAGMALESKQAAAEQAAAASESEDDASANAASAASSASAALDSLQQVQEIVAALDVDNLVHKNGEEEIDGAKSFIVLPQVPTASIGSCANVPATTAWIGQKFQVVDALPEQPDENTFYFIPE